MKLFKSLKNTASSFLDPYKQQNPATYAAAQQAIGGLLILDGFVGIENPFDGQNKRAGIFGSLIAIILGCVFVFGQGLLGNFLGFNKMTGETTATVVSVGAATATTNTTNSDNTSSSASCPMTVKYSVNGQEYTNQSSASSSSQCSLAPGQTVTVNYDPNNPGAWVYDLGTIKMLFGIFPLAGGLIALSGLFTFAIRLASIIFGWKILRSGRALAATLPVGTNLDTMKNEIRQNFMAKVFNFGGGNTPSNPAPPVPPAAA